MPTITQLPPPPSTSDPINFSSKADAHILALQEFTAEVNAFSSELSGAGIITPARNTLVATATATELWINSVIQDWTGSPTITALPNALAAGSQRIVYPATGTVITHGGGISVQGNANYTVESGDELTITAITVSTFYVTIKKKTGRAVVAIERAIATSAEAIAGTSDIVVISPLQLRNGLNASGTAPIYACRAWVNFNGTGTVAIRASGNVSSITDNGVGDYTVNFLTAMPDANYSVSTNCMSVASGFQAQAISQIRASDTANGSLATTSVRISTGNSTSASFLDFTTVTSSIFR